MKTIRIPVLFLLAAWLLAACAAPAGPAVNTPVSQETPVPETGSLPEAVFRAREALAAELGMEPREIVVQNAGAAEFPDGCLGFGMPDEVCTDALVAGYRGTFIAGEEQYEFRVSESGEQARFIPGAALSARQALAQQLGLDLDEVQILMTERVEWPDSCLGVEVMDMACAQMITPGYRIVLQANGQTYEYHSDVSGDMLMVAAAPGAAVEGAVLDWQRADGGCQEAHFASGQVTFGECGERLLTAPYATQERAAELAEFLQTYARFEAATPAGQVTFYGQGSQPATPAEQRMIAEWASLVFTEASSVQSEASSGLAFTWHREGGFAGFCNDLTVYLTGDVVAAPCPGGQPVRQGQARLSLKQLEQLYDWVDRLQSFEFDRTDPATADAMTIRLSFYGRGDQEPTEAEQGAILEFAAELYTALQQEQAPAESFEAGGGEEAARQALFTYFSAFSDGDFARAVELYGGSYEALQGNNPEIDPDDRQALMEAACRYNGFRCDLQVREVVRGEQESEGTYRFTLQFNTPDGQLFELGPCCGADPAEAPSVSQFDYTVEVQKGEVRVLDLPVYQP